MSSHRSAVLFFSAWLWLWLGTCCVRAQLLITELVSKNASGGLRDEDGEHSDWLEIYNTSAEGINLGGYYLSDESALPLKWPFPEVVLGPSSYLVVFASGKDRDAGQLHTNFKLTSAGESVGISQADGSSVHWITYPLLPSLVSYGLAEPTAGAALIYLSAPTPGAVNPANANLLAFGPAISVPSKTFQGSFTVTVTPHSPGTIIRYTLDGRVPLVTSPVLLGPLTITTSTRLRCREYLTGGAAGQISGETYLLVAPDAAAASSNLPLLVLDNFQGGRPTNGTMAEAQFFEPSGISGRSSLMQAPSLRSLSIIRVRGSSTGNDAKASLSLEFRHETDLDRKLRPLGMPSESDWVLQAPFTYDRSLIRNPLVYEISNDLGQYAAKTRQVEVYLNTDGGPISAADYAGVYTFMEKVERGEDRVDIQGLDATENSLPQLAGGYIFKLDRPDPGDTGFAAAGNQRFYFVDPKEQLITVNQRNWLEGHLNNFWASLNATQFRDPVGGYGAFLDVPAAIDHHLINTMTKNVDGLRLSTYFSKSRYGKLTFGPVWDFDRSMDSLDARDNNFDTWRGETGDLGTDYFRQPIWAELFRDGNFWQQWIDRFAALRKGPWRSAVFNARVDRLAAEVAEAAPRNFARWPEAPPRTSWQAEVNLLKGWLANRLDWMDHQLLPVPLANMADQGGGMVAPGFQLSLTPSFAPPNGAVLYYTTDGTDPRIPETATVWDIPCVTATTPIRVLVPTADPGVAWRTISYADQSWISGTRGMGYDDETTYLPYFGVNLKPPVATMKNTMGSAYLRGKFSLTAAQIQNLGKLELRIRFDDAFVAWLNGTQVAQGGALPGTVLWNSQATAGNPDTEALVPRAFDLTGYLDKLVVGQNVLAIQGLNYQLTSTDFLIEPLLSGASKVPSISSSAQLYTDPFVIQGSQQLTARYYLPGLPHTPWPYTGVGSLQAPVGSSWSAPIRLSLYTDAAAAGGGLLQLAEILPRPQEASDYEQAAGWDRRGQFSYILIRNTSSVQALDLNAVHLTGAVEHVIAPGPHSRLAPGGAVLLVRNVEAFASRYGSPYPIVGQYLHDLPLAGGTVELRSAAGVVLDSLAYGLEGPLAWRDYVEAGNSLVRIPGGNDWRVSLDPQGELPGTFPASYTDWQLRHFSNKLPSFETLSDPLADPDGDGQDNWMEFVLGTQPQEANPLPMRVENTPLGPRLCLTRRIQLFGTTLKAWTSPDMAQWQQLGNFPTVGSPNSQGTQTVKIPLPMSAQKAFFRVEITD